MLTKATQFIVIFAGRDISFLFFFHLDIINSDRPYYVVRENLIVRYANDSGATINVFCPDEMCTYLRLTTLDMISKPSGP